MQHRRQEITQSYFIELEKHLSDLLEGKVEKTHTIGDFASILCVDPGHLSNTLFEVTGKSPCTIYEEKLIEISCSLLRTTALPVSHIASKLTYDASNFSKFFKSYMGVTPGKYRKDHFEKEFTPKK